MTNQNTAENQNTTDTKTSKKQILSASVCSNCANQDDCVILAGSLSPVIQCELYECCSLVKPELVGKKHSDPVIENELEGVHLLGLCTNCDNRLHCKLPKTPSGVWHCEEYC